MGSNEFFEPAYKHVGSDEHLYALIWDEMDAAIRGFTNDAIGIAALPDNKQIVDGLMASGVMMQKPGRASISGATMLDAWRKAAFAVAMVNMNPFNSRVNVSVNPTGSTLDVGIGGDRLFDSSVFVNAITNRDEARALIMGMCASVNNLRGGGGPNPRRAIAHVERMAKSMMVRDHRTDHTWPPKAKPVAHHSPGGDHPPSPEPTPAAVSYHTYGTFNSLTST